MSNCYPSRINKIGNKEASICEVCANRLSIKFKKLEPFWRDDLMKVSDEIENEEILTWDQGCIYINIDPSFDFYKMLILECNQFKPLEDNIMSENDEEFLDMDFINWIRKYGDEQDKDTLQGSGLPTHKDRELSKKAYKKYMKWLTHNS